MIRERLMKIAEEHGLKLATDRITTGTEKAGFHTFEFTGGDLATACKVIRQEWGVSKDFCTCRISEADGLPYMEVSSFYIG